MGCTLRVGRWLLCRASILQTKGRHIVSRAVCDGRAVGTYYLCLSVLQAKAQLAGGVHGAWLGTLVPAFCACMTQLGQASCPLTSCDSISAQ